MMKSWIKILPAVLVVMGLMASTADAMKRYESRSGYIRYEGTNGSEELYWDNYGEREARYRNTSVTVFGMTQTDNSVDIIDGDWLYTYKQGESQANKTNYTEVMKQMTGSQQSQPREFSEAMIKQWGGKKIGTERILGKKCEIYQFSMMGDYKVWLYKKTIPLKMEVNAMMVNIVSEAKEFKENARIDSSKFRLPSGMQIVEQNVDVPSAEEMQAYRNQMNDMQNNPEFQEAMQQMQQLQNNPEFQNAVQQMKEMQNNPEFQNAMEQMRNIQNNSNYQGAVNQAQEAMQQNTNYPNYGNSGSASGNAAGGTLVGDTVDIIKDETSTAVKDGVRQKTKDLLGGGLKKFLN